MPNLRGACFQYGGEDSKQCRSHTGVPLNQFCETLIINAPGIRLSFPFSSAWMVLVSVDRQEWDCVEVDLEGTALERPLQLAGAANLLCFFDFPSKYTDTCRLLFAFSVRFVVNQR